MRLKSWHFGLLFTSLLCLFLCIAGSASADSNSAIWPQQTAVTNSGGSLLVDASGAQNGYFFAASSYQTSHRLKLRVIKDGTTFTYDLKTDASYELFPLQLGTGYYEIHLYENVSGKKYAQKQQNADYSAVAIYMNRKTIVERPQRYSRKPPQIGQKKSFA